MSAIGTSAAGNPGVRNYSQTFLVTGTFVVPNGVSVVYFTGCSGGSGGGGGHTADPGGGGGGGGGIAISRVPLLVTAGSTLTVTVGIAGVGGAAGASGGIVSCTTSIAGLTIGTFSLPPLTAAGPGLVGNGGAGATFLTWGGGGAQSTTTANPSTLQTFRGQGGEFLNYTGGASGGGASNQGGASVGFSGYNAMAVGTNAAASGTKGGGGGGGSGMFGVGASGGSGAVGATATVGYGAGGGGGAATFAGGNGTAGIAILEWYI